MKRTQTMKIICFLAAGKPLTPLAALRRFGTFRLGARIYDLRKLGHKIDRAIVQRGDKHVAEYRLAKGAK